MKDDGPGWRNQHSNPQITLTFIVHYKADRTEMMMMMMMMMMITN